MMIGVKRRPWRLRYYYWLRGRFQPGQIETQGVSLFPIDATGLG
jgi:hypothetical protein